KIAFLAFTDLLNIDRNQKAADPWVRVLDVESALDAVAAAREQADAVVVSIHWGTEYSHQPTKRQRVVAQKLIAGGVDLILGHHPHVLQPIEWIEAGARPGLVAFPWGNSVSNQARVYRPHQSVAAGDSGDGRALFCAFSQARSPEGIAQVTLGDVRYEPLWTENNWPAWASGKAKPREIRVVR